MYKRAPQNETNICCVLKRKWLNCFFLKFKIRSLEFASSNYWVSVLCTSSFQFKKKYAETYNYIKIFDVAFFTQALTARMWHRIDIELKLCIYSELILELSGLFTLKLGEFIGRP